MISCNSLLDKQVPVRRYFLKTTFLFRRGGRFWPGCCTSRDGRRRTEPRLCILTLNQGLLIRAIFGRIRIRRIRIFTIGSGSSWHSPRINSNIWFFFFLSIRFMQIFLCKFFYLKEWKNSPENLKSTILKILYFFTQLPIHSLDRIWIRWNFSGSGKKGPDQTGSGSTTLN